MAVTRCVCHEVPFTEILRLSREEGLSFDDIRARTNCCTGCTMCEPYVRLALRTGETDLPVLTPEQTAEIMRSADD